MSSGKLVWFVAVQLTIFKGCSFSNTTQDLIKAETPLSNTTLRIKTPPIIDIQLLNSNASGKALKIAVTPTEGMKTTSTRADETRLDLVKIFQGDSNATTGAPTEQILNTTIIKDCINVTSVNPACIDQSWNDTFKTNYTTVAEAVGASAEGYPAFRLQNSAAIAAGVFLVSAVIGYFSCVGYRRFMQRKYGNSQILIGEEVYDTTDLRYFEI